MRVRKPKPDVYYLKDAAQRLGIVGARLYQHMRQLKVVPKGTRGSFYLTQEQLQIIADHRAAMAKSRPYIKMLGTQAAVALDPILEGTSTETGKESRSQRFVRALKEGKTVIDLVESLGASPVEADIIFKWYHERRGHIMVPARVVRHLEKLLGPVDSFSLGEVVERTILSYKSCFQCGGPGAIALCPKCREPKIPTPDALKETDSKEPPLPDEDIEIAIATNRRRAQLGLPLLPIPGEASSTTDPKP